MSSRTTSANRRQQMTELARRRLRDAGAALYGDAERLRDERDAAITRLRKVERELRGAKVRTRTEAHFIVIPQFRIAYARVPKVANTSVKNVLAELVELESDDLKPSNDGFWRRRRGGIDIVKPEELLLSYPGYFSFAFVREPRDRLLSFYSANLGRWNLSDSLAAQGFEKEMALADFVDRVCEIPDEEADIHFLPQSRILSYRGQPIPTFIGRYDRLTADWGRLRTVLSELREVNLPELPVTNQVERDERHARDIFDEALTRKIFDRYAEDYELFFPDL